MKKRVVVTGLIAVALVGAAIAVPTIAKEAKGGEAVAERSIHHESAAGVETTLTFDSSILQLDDVTPGDWFTGSGQDFFFFDYTPEVDAGTIHLASSVLDGALQGAGILAVVPLAALPGVGQVPVSGYLAVGLLFSGFSLMAPWASAQASPCRFKPARWSRPGRSISSPRWVEVPW